MLLTILVTCCRVCSSLPVSFLWAQNWAHHSRYSLTNAKWKESYFLQSTIHIPINKVLAWYCLSAWLSEHSDDSCSICCLPRLQGHFLRHYSPAQTSPVCTAARDSFFPSAELVELKVPASHSLHPVKVLLNSSSPLSHIKDAECCYLLKYRSQDIQANDFISFLCYLWWKGIRMENKQHHNDRKRKVHN